MTTHAEVSDFDLAIREKQDVMGLDIPVDHLLLLVQVFKALQQLGSQLHQNLLGDRAHFLQNTGKTAHVCVLQRDTHSTFRQKSTIRLNYVWVLAVVQGA